MKKSIIMRHGKDVLRINITTKRNYFSITGDLFEKWSLYADKYEERIKFEGETYVLYSCGCIHEEILEARPDLKPLVDLHLSDLDGLPMHFIENGMYHLRNNLDHAASHFRLPMEAIESMVKMKPDERLVFATDQIARYKQEAKRAIELIESL